MRLMPDGDDAALAAAVTDATVNAAGLRSTALNAQSVDACIYCGPRASSNKSLVTESSLEYKPRNARLVGTCVRRQPGNHSLNIL